MWMALPLFGEREYWSLRYFHEAVFASTRYIKKKKKDNFQNVVICTP